MNKIRLTYRAFAREHRAVEDRFQQVLAKVACATVEGMLIGQALPELQIAGPETVLWPVDEPTAEKFREDGILLTREEGKPHDLALVREWVVTIEAGDRDWMIAILKETGEVFTNIELVDEVFTDVPPQ